MIVIPLLLALAADCVGVSGDRITAGELASAISVLSALPPSTPLGYSPVMGARRTLKASALNSVLEAQGNAGRVDADVCVQRLQRKLEREEFLAAMRKAFAPREVVIDVVEFSQYGAPEGELEFAVKDLATPSSPRLPVRWRGMIRYDGNRRFDIWARVRLTAEGQRIVAAESLAAGQPIQATQVREETNEGFPKVTTITLADVIGRAPVRPIPAGAEIGRSLLGTPMAVARGGVVTAEYRSGAVLLRVPMMAERAGQVGETIPVRNPASKKLLPARVTAAGEVTIGETRTTK